MVLPLSAFPEENFKNMNRLVNFLDGWSMARDGKLVKKNLDF